MNKGDYSWYFRQVRREAEGLREENLRRERKVKVMRRLKLIGEILCIFGAVGWLWPLFEVCGLGGL